MCQGCTFETDRLLVTPWHNAALPTAVPIVAAPSLSDDLAAIVMMVMSEPVTRTLPEPWRGPFDRSRAETWIAEVDAEATGLVVMERELRRAVGLMILFAEEISPEETELRVGYMLSEPHWGQGFASELIAGLVRWCRSTPSVTRVVAGVERANAPSIRVLEKVGFAAEPNHAEHTVADELSFALDVR